MNTTSRFLELQSHPSQVISVPKNKTMAYVHYPMTFMKENRRDKYSIAKINDIVVTP